MKSVWSVMLAVILAAPAALADPTNELIDAAYRGDLDLARALLATGASVRVEDARGDSPLHWAAREGHLALVELLIAKGALLDLANREGETPLMQATSHGQVEIVRALLAHGASLEPRDREGRNVAQLAISSGMDALIVLVTEATNGVRPELREIAAAAGPERVSLVSLEERMRTLGTRIDKLPYGDRPLAAPPALPRERWAGEKFMFLPMEREQPEEAPSFALGTAKQGPDGRNAPYESLVGRVGTVIKSEGNVVLMQLDDDGTLLRGEPGPYGNLPELAPALDLFIARKLYTGKILWPKDPVIERYTLARGPESRLRIGPGVPLLVRGVFPAESATNPIRLILETADGRQGFLDFALSGTNAPTVAGGRKLFRFGDLFFAGDPHKLWGPAVWGAIKAGKVLGGFSADQVRAAWGQPDRIEGSAWVYDDGRVVHFADGRVVR